MRKFLISLVFVVSSPLAVAAITTSCKSRRSSADPKLIGGVDAAQDIHPWSVRLHIVHPDRSNSMCTGTFVSPSAMLTASHCVRPGSVVYVPRYKDAASSAIYKHPQHGGQVDKYDVAVVVFPADTAEKFTGLATRMPKLNEVVSFIGYGSCTVWDGADAGSRRCMGSNTVSQVNSEGMIFTQLGVGPGGVAISPGDSGGPMFIETNRIAGVASGGGFGRNSSHTNLLMPANLEFLREIAKKDGVVICGLDEQQCEGAGIGGADDLMARTNSGTLNKPNETSDSPEGQSIESSGDTQAQSQGQQAYDESRPFSYRGRTYYCPSGMVLRIARNNRVYCSQ